MKIQLRAQKHIEMSRASQFSSVITCFWNYSRYHFQKSFNKSGKMLSLVFSAVTVRAIINVNNATTTRPKLNKTPLRYRSRKCYDTDCAVKLSKITFIYFNIISIITQIIRGLLRLPSNGECKIK
jgi:hypothetical protein